MDQDLAKAVGGILTSDPVTNGIMIIAALKLVWHLSKADSYSKETRAMAVRAHKRIDKIKDDGEG